MGEPAGRSEARSYLMCPPSYFAVVYRINPWMDPARPVDRHRAMQQWLALRDAYVGAGHRVVVVEASPDQPDMVFTANAGLVVGGKGVLARFRHEERSGEEPAQRAWFEALGLTDVVKARYAMEGEGDYAPIGQVILGASGFRTDARSHDQVAEVTGRPVIGLHLVDERFYHLDTALAVLDQETVAWWPGAFSSRSRALLREMFPEAIEATEEDAVAFGLNACSDGRRVLMSRGARRLAAAVRERGFNTVLVDTSELQLAGGSAKCATLEVRC
ncbi:MAG: dimethylargininase [Acidimicrobiales bacterium]